MVRRSLRAGAFFVVLGLGVGMGAAAAQAQTTGGSSTYTGVPAPNVGGVQSGVEAQSLAQAPAAVPLASSGSLPLTGTDAVELAAIGLGLIGTGIVVRRATRAKRSA